MRTSPLEKKNIENFSNGDYSLIAAIHRQKVDNILFLHQK